MTAIDVEYKKLVSKTLLEGMPREDRTGVGTIAIFGYQYEVNVFPYFPLLTTKKVLFDKVYYELMAFLRGETNIAGFDKCRKLWEPWAGEGGDLGPIYGSQWTGWYAGPGAGYIDQIDKLLYSLEAHPHSRRHIVSAWNVGELDNMALVPCHMMFQCFLREGRLPYGPETTFLDLNLTQRSLDLAIGAPFNIASYSLLMYMICHELIKRTGKDYTPGRFIHSIGDAHIYNNHIDSIRKQIDREHKERPAGLILSDDLKFKEFCTRNSYDDINLVNYEYHPYIRYEVAV